MPKLTNHRIDYLVGGFRISVGPSSTTPGPRTHILGFTRALSRAGHDVRLLLASSFPGMARFGRVKQSDYQSASKAKVVLADVIRMVAGIWSGANVFVRSLGALNTTDILYERVAVFQSLSSFHPAKRKAFRIVEANGVLARETARDRKILALEGLATWLERRTLRRADLVVAVSEALAQELQEYAGLDADALLVLPNGADPSTIAMPDRSDPTHPVIGFVGSVVAWHRLDALLETFAQLRQTDAPLMEGARIEIIGDGPEIPKLRGLASASGLEELVTFVGGLPHEAALARMQRWSIGFAGHEKSSSSVMYHSPLKLYEYAALGLVIACSPSADARSLREAGTDVQMYDPSTHDSMTHALRDAVQRSKADSPAARSARRAAIEAAHSWDARAGALLHAVESGRDS